jgi:nucleotide-binding universal stress UspA family protein
MTLQHFLVPVDFSGQTPAAVSTAVELARKFSARLTLLHVVGPVLPPTGDFYLVAAMAPMTATYSENLIEAARQELNALVARTLGGVPVDTVIKLGIPWHCIVDFAAEYPTDLVVMSNRGRSGLKHLWLGSVAGRVVQHAPCPVLVVRPRMGGSPPLSLTNHSKATQPNPKTKIKYYERDYALESPT